MEKPKRARRRKPETAKVDLQPSRKNCGGQGVHREVESDGLAEKHRAVAEGGDPVGEPVGQRRGKVEPALWRRRHIYPPVVPRCVRTARCGRTVRDPRRACMVSVWYAE